MQVESTRCHLPWEHCLAWALFQFGCIILVTTKLSFSQQRPRAPENRRFAVRIADGARTVQIILRVVLLIRADADFADVSVFIDVTAQADPAAPRDWAVIIRVEPAVLHAGYQRVSEHSGATRFVPRLRIVHELPPQA